MLWITKYRHNKIVEQYKEAIKDLKEELNRKDLITEILDRITKKEESPFISVDDMDRLVSSAGVMDSIDDTIPRYVDDYFGGRVIKQEATPVTILDSEGKATYGLTAKRLPKGHNYHLVQGN